ncbi:MAG: amidohydrolase family protein [Pseudomonadales bacterium]|jgi:predicted TIM-barrel fold metal-dependent hydrolase|nr:amidohydrolase family protein [Pseudomonadales bacterium]
MSARLSGLVALSWLIASSVLAEQGPVLDVHLHAATADMNGPPGQAVCVPMLAHLPTPDPAVPWPRQFMGAMMNPRCEDPVVGPSTDDEVMRQTIEQLEQNQAIGVLSGPPDRVRAWMAAAPGRFLPSLQLNLARDPYGPEEVRSLLTDGGFLVIGEISNQYQGIGPDDERMDGFYAVAAELDVPVAIHMGTGPPGAAMLMPSYRVRLGDPMLLEPVLAKYPNLRVTIMHMAEGFPSQLKTLLYTYPNVYVDIGGLSWMRTAEEFERTLLDLVDAGFGGRIMFGSDQMNWPGLITPAIDVIRESPYLTDAEKEAILWSNAVRFLKLDDAEMRKRAAAE